MKKEVITVVVAVVLITVGLCGCNEKTPSNEQFSVESKTLYVDDSGGKNYTSIQDAINHSSDGDSIFVYSGMYNENLLINKSITLIGENRDTTIINKSVSAEEGGTLITIYAPGVIIKGFTISNPSSWIYATAIDLKQFSTAEQELLSANNTTINNCKFVDSQVGISVTLVSYSVISDCIFYNNSDEGICLNILSSYNLIKNCTFFNCKPGTGIELQNSNFNNIVNCEMYNNDYGICITPMLYPFSFNNSISNCLIYNNCYGIYMYNASDNSIFTCYVSNNSASGIRLSGESYGNTVYDSIFNNNSEYGVCIGLNQPFETPYNNKIYRNNFFNNGGQTWWLTQAHDDGNNSWDNDKVGNYWDDYNGTDEDDNGIGDTPYNIPGGDNQDLYPLMNPFDI